MGLQVPEALPCLLSRGAVARIVPDPAVDVVVLGPRTRGCERGGATEERGSHFVSHEKNITLA